MVKLTILNIIKGKGFSPFLNFFMVKFTKDDFDLLCSFSPFLNFFMVKYFIAMELSDFGFSPFLNFFMVKYTFTR